MKSRHELREAVFKNIIPSRKYGIRFYRTFRFRTRRNLN